MIFRLDDRRDSEFRRKAEHGAEKPVRARHSLHQIVKERRDFFSRLLKMFYFNFSDLPAEPGRVFGIKTTADHHGGTMWKLFDNLDVDFDDDKYEVKPNSSLKFMPAAKVVIPRYKRKTKATKKTRK